LEFLRTLRIVWVTSSDGTHWWYQDESHLISDSPTSTPFSAIASALDAAEKPSDTTFCAIPAKRVTIQSKDIQLVLHSTVEAIAGLGT
jgi:hypothetical protein